MKALEERIISQGQVIGNDIVKVDSFLNHQLDIALIREIGQEFRRVFTTDRPTKILTIESSGIAIAVLTASSLGDLPVVFAKKTVPNTMNDDMLSAEVRSFTKGTISHVVAARRFIQPQDRVLIIDDFLAHGEAALGLLSIIEQAGATPVGIGVAIEKVFQGGGQRVRERGVKLHALAAIEKIENGHITFCTEKQGRVG